MRPELRPNSPRRCSTGAVCAGGQGRDRTADLPLFRRSLIPTELPGQTGPRLCQEPRHGGGPRLPAPHPRTLATQTGLEPATFAVTGRRANQLRHWALQYYSITSVLRAPNGIRTRAAASKGRQVAAQCLSPAPLGTRGTLADTHPMIIRGHMPRTMPQPSDPRREADVPQPISWTWVATGHAIRRRPGVRRRRRGLATFCHPIDTVRP